MTKSLKKKQKFVRKFNKMKIQMIYNKINLNNNNKNKIQIIQIKNQLKKQIKIEK